MLRFEHESLPQRVCFASGQAAAMLAGEIQRLGASRVMVLASQSEAERSEQLTADLPVVVHHNEIAMHVPVEVAERARTAAARHEVDAIVSVGGGSTTGLAKAIALTTGLPIVAVPTTYAGSEATNVWGLTEGARKTTGVDARVLPRAVIYDPELTLSLPAPMSVASGLNALAHCVDSMWGPRSDPIDRALAQEGIRALRTGAAVGGGRSDQPDRPGTRLVCGVPVRGGVLLGGLGTAPQDLPCPRRGIRPAACPDPRGRVAVCARIQRPRGTGSRTPHRDRTRREHRTRRPTETA